jgi:hypothetical protein
VAGSSEIRLRALQLLSAAHRRKLAESFEEILRDADEPLVRRSSRIPPQRQAVRDARAALVGLVLDLRDSRPVEPRGVAKAELLLSDGASPLYAPNERGALSEAAQDARDALGLAA